MERMNKYDGIYFSVNINLKRPVKVKWKYVKAANDHISDILYEYHKNLYDDQPQVDKLLNNGIEYIKLSSFSKDNNIKNKNIKDDDTVTLEFFNVHFVLSNNINNLDHVFIEVLDRIIREAYTLLTWDIKYYDYETHAAMNEQLINIRRKIFVKAKDRLDTRPIKEVKESTTVKFGLYQMSIMKGPYIEESMSNIKNLLSDIIKEEK